MPAILLCLGVSVSPGARIDACLQYLPERVLLTGTLKRMTFAGPPGYKSIPDGDARETGYYLALTMPVCVDGDAKDDTAYPQSDVALVQLAHDAKDVNELTRQLGRTVHLSGALFAAHTMHHHAPIVLTDVKIESRQR